MKILSTILAISAVTAAPRAFADDASPPKEVSGMSCLVGGWKAKGSFTMGGQKADVTGTWKCGWLPSKWGVSCDADLAGIPGTAHYLERDLMGFEPNSRTYHWYAVTNAGETHDHVAAFTESNDLEFVYQGTQDGKPMKEVIDIRMAADSKSFHLKSEVFVGGASVGVLEVDGRK
jgi:hypothetical protein